MNRIAIVSCEGVINQRQRIVGNPAWDRPEFLPGALDGLKLLAREGYQVVVISEPIRRAAVGPDRELRKRWRQRWLLEIALYGGRVERFYDRPVAPAVGPSPHHVEIMTSFVRWVFSTHRASAEDSFFVADSLEDAQVAANLGCIAFVVRREAFLCFQPAAGVVETASNLMDTAERVLFRRANPLLHALKGAPTGLVADS